MDARVTSLIVVSMLMIGVGRANAQDVATVRAQAQSVPDGVWLHYAPRTDARPQWVGACAAPCALTFAYDAVLGLSLDGSRPHRLAWQPLPERASLTLRFDDHARVRMLGAVVTVVGAIAGIVLALWGVIHAAETPGADQTSSYAAMISGAGVLTLGLAIGIPLMTDPDRLSIDVVP